MKIPSPAEIKPYGEKCNIVKHYQKIDVTRHYIFVHIKDGRKSNYFWIGTKDGYLESKNDVSRGELFEFYEFSNGWPTEDEYEEIFGYKPILIGSQGTSKYDWQSIDTFQLDGLPKPTKSRSRLCNS